MPTNPYMGGDNPYMDIGKQTTDNPYMALQLPKKRVPAKQMGEDMMSQLVGLDQPVGDPLKVTHPNVYAAGKTAVAMPGLVEDFAMSVVSGATFGLPERAAEAGEWLARKLFGEGRKGGATGTWTEEPGLHPYVEKGGKFVGSMITISALGKTVAAPIITSVMKHRHMAPFARMIGWGAAGAGYKAGEQMLGEGELPTPKELVKHGATWAGIEAVMSTFGWTGQLAIGLNRLSKIWTIPRKEVLKTITKEAKVRGVPLAKYIWTKAKVQKVLGAKEAIIAKELLNTVDDIVKPFKKRGTVTDLVKQLETESIEGRIRSFKKHVDEAIIIGQKPKPGKITMKQMDKAEKILLKPGVKRTAEEVAFLKSIKTDLKLPAPKTVPKPTKLFPAKEPAKIIAKSTETAPKVIEKHKLTRILTEDLPDWVRRTGEDIRYGTPVSKATLRRYQHYFAIQGKKSAITPYSTKVSKHVVKPAPGLGRSLPKKRIKKAPAKKLLPPKGDSTALLPDERVTAKAVPKPNLKAALKYPNGQIVTGRTHLECLEKAEKLGLNKQVTSKKQIEEGFQEFYSVVKDKKVVDVSSGHRVAKTQKISEAIPGKFLSRSETQLKYGTGISEELRAVGVIETGKPKTQQKPALISSTLRGPQIHLEFDNRTGSVPSKETIKQYAESKGYDIAITKFKTGLKDELTIGGIRDTTRFRLDVFKEGRLSTETASKLSKEFGGIFTGPSAKLLGIIKTPIKVLPKEIRGEVKGYPGYAKVTVSGKKGTTLGFGPVGQLQNIYEKLMAGRLHKPLKKKMGDVLPRKLSPDAQIIMTALKKVKPLSRKQQEIYSLERGKRLGEAIRLRGVTSGERGYHAELAALKGPMETVQFEPIKKLVTQKNVDNMMNEIRDCPVLSNWETYPARKALARMLQGSMPTEGGQALLRDVFGKKFVDTMLSNKALWKKVKEAGIVAINFPKAIKSSYDLSAPLRQGVFMIRRYKQWLPAFRDMFKYFGSKEAYHEAALNIRRHHNYKLAKEHKLALTDLGNLTNREEAFQSPWAEKIPGVGASARAYTGFLNQLRFDVFNDFVKKGKRLGLLDDPKYLKTAAKYINHATGRGHLLGLEGAATELNAVFFSPRLIMSRLQLVNPVFYVRLQKHVRKEALKDLFAFAGLSTTVAGLAKMAGCDIELDPRNADFMKIRVGNKRYDILGGLQQVIRATAQFVTGEIVSSTTGKTLTLGEGYKPMTRLGVAGRFLQYKLSPVSSFVVTMLTGQATMGGKADIPTEIGRLFVPMAAQDIYEVYNDEGLSAIPLATPAFFGVGLQTYGGVSTYDLAGKDYRFLNTELTRLKTSMGFPSISAYGQSLSNKEYKQFKTKAGKEIARSLENIMHADFYKKATDDAKRHILDKVTDHTKEDVKRRMFRRYKLIQERAMEIRKATYKPIPESRDLAEEQLKQILKGK